MSSPSSPLAVVRAAHPLQALVTAAAVAVAAALSHRQPREVALVFATVLVGQAVLGWHNDVADEERDRRVDARKPLVDGLDPGTVWFAAACGLLLVIPLSLSAGVTAGICYLLSLVVGLLGNVVLRGSLLSPLPWIASFALYPAYLSYGGWGGQFVGHPPTIAMTALAGALGIGVHVLLALPGLVADREEDLDHLPLRLGRKLGATRLLLVASVYTLAVVVALLVVGATNGLRLY